MLQLVTYDNELLHQQSFEVDEIDGSIKQLVKDMFKTMYASQGIGLAAVQVGVLKRIFVIDIPKEGKYTMINPVITDFSMEKSVYEEGCLSVPGIGAEVERPAKVTVEYTDLKGKRKSLEAEGLLATCIQHEFDHLKGILFIDKISPEVRLNKLKEYRKSKIV